MRLHRLTLRDVKAVQERTVHFPDHGVVVIEGANETGKSTLLEALDRLLDPRSKASSTARSIRALQPAGVDAGPCVEAELTIGPYRLVFAKQWLRQTSTVLRIVAPAPEQFTGDEAQTRMTQILEECLDRPLFDALRFTQSGEPAQVALSDSSVLAAALDGAAGGDLHSDAGADLMGLVDREHATYYTPTGRPTGVYRAAIAEANEAQAVAVQAHGKVVESRQLLAERAGARVALDEAELFAPVLARRVSEREVEVAAAQAAGVAQREAEREAVRSREVANRATLDLRARRAQVAEAGQRRTAVQQAQAAEDAWAARCQAVGDELLASQNRCAAARSTLDSAQEDVEVASSRERRRAAVLDARTLQGRLSRAETGLGELATAEADLQTEVVTPDLLHRIQRADRACEVARTKVDAVATLVRIESLSGRRLVEIGRAEHLLEAGRPVRELALSEETDIVLPGLLRVQVRPVSDASRSAAELAAAQRSLAVLLADAGVGDLAAAELAGRVREQVVASVQRWRAEVAIALAGEPIEAVRSRLRRVQESLEGDPTQASAEIPSADAQEVLRVAQEGLLRARAGWAAEEGVRERLRRESTVATQELAVVRAKVESAITELASAVTRLDRDRADVSDEDLSQAVNKAQAALGEADRERERAGAAVSSYEPHAEQRLDTAQEELLAHRAQVQALRDRWQHLKGRIEMAAGEGRQETYELAVQAFEEAREELRSIDRRARAARELRETLRRHRELAHDSYVGPYRRELERLGRQVYGDTFGVSVSRDLVITHRRLQDTTLPFECLSGGTKEQLGVLARLAVASLVDAGQGVPVVVDDALGFSDPDRLARLGRVLTDPAIGGQLIMLTCTPQRYAAIEGAVVVRLTA